VVSMGGALKGHASWVEACPGARCPRQGARHAGHSRQWGTSGRTRAAHMVERHGSGRARVKRHTDRLHGWGQRTVLGLDWCGAMPVGFTWSMAGLR
jgi:hypothetical protein